MIPLEQNYRSTNAILNAANVVISHNRERKEKRPLVGARRGRARARGRGRGRARRGRASSPPRSPALVEDGTSLSEIAVVYRTNAQSRVLEDILVRQGDRLPGDRRAAVLRARRDQGRDRVPAGARQPDRRGLADADREPAAARRGRHVARAAADASPTAIGISLWEALGRAEEAGLAAASLRAVQSLRTLLQSLHGGRAGACASPSSSSSVLERSGYLDALEAERTIEARGRIENLEELVGVAREYEAARAPRSRRSRSSCRRSRCTRHQDELDDDECGPGDADDAPQREGPGVPRRLHARDGGRDLPALALDRGERRSRRSGGSATSA